MTDRAASLAARLFVVVGGELVVGDVPVTRLVEQFGTPLYVYDASVLKAKWRLLRDTLPDGFTIAYSVKANPNPAIIATFLALGAELEIASGGELQCALWAGGAPPKMLFAGPGKTEFELELALKHGIGEVHAESVTEVQRLDRIARRLGTVAPVALRVNPGDEVQGGAMQMGGKPAAFGIDEEALGGAIEVARLAPGVEFRGIHLFAGTQILDHAVLLRQFRKGVDIAARVADSFDGTLQTLDFGGGWGIPYFESERQLDTDRVREGLGDLVRKARGHPGLAETRFVIEPGRFLVAEAGVYVTRVTDVKVSRGKRFLVVDGGMHQHLAASGNLGQVIKRNFPVGLLAKLGASRHEVVDVVGPLCTPLDVLAREVALPPAEVGDILGVLQSGAYARTASPLGFLSHPAPPEVLAEHGTARLIRRRGTYEDLGHDLPDLGRP